MAARERTKTSPIGSRATASGFTLMELLVVLGILGLALALALPSLGRAFPGLELRSDARSVAGGLREARGLAIGQNREVAVIIDVEQRTLRLGSQALIRLNPKLDISVQSATSEASAHGAGSISFFPDGTSTGGRITLVLGERRRHVVVDWLTGAISTFE